MTGVQTCALPIWSPRRREGGGTSIPGLYIVGFARAPAAGVWEVVALLSAWCVWLACFSSGGGGPWIFVDARLTSSCSGPLGLGLSAPDPAGIWRLKMVDSSFATAPSDLGVTSSGAVNRDFPATGAGLVYPRIVDEQRQRRATFLVLVAGEVGA